MIIPLTKLIDVVKKFSRRLVNSYVLTRQMSSTYHYYDSIDDDNEGLDRRILYCNTAQ